MTEDLKRRLNVLIVLCSAVLGLVFVSFVFLLQPTLSDLIIWLVVTGTIVSVAFVYAGS